MRVLVVTGAYPPMPGPAARHALAEVGRLSSAGDDVEVLSSRPSAAHHHHRLAGLSGVVALAWRSRSYDRLVLRLEARVPVRARVAALDAAALAAGLRLWRSVTLSVDDLSSLPLAPGGRSARALWRRADLIVVAGASDRERLRAEGGVPADGVVERRDDAHARATAAPGPGGTAGGPASAGADPARTRLALMVRVRAASAASDVVPGAWPLPAGPAPLPRPTTAPGWCVWLARKVVRGALGRHADTVLGPVFRARLAVAGLRGRRVVPSGAEPPPAGGAGWERAAPGVPAQPGDDGTGANAVR